MSWKKYNNVLHILGYSTSKHNMLPSSPSMSVSPGTPVVPSFSPHKFICESASLSVKITRWGSIIEDTKCSLILSVACMQKKKKWVCKNLLQVLGICRCHWLWNWGEVGQKPPPPQIFTRKISGLTKFIAAGGCMIYLFVIDTTLINEAAMWSIYTVMIWWEKTKQMEWGWYVNLILQVVNYTDCSC